MLGKYIKILCLVFFLCFGLFSNGQDLSLYDSVDICYSKAIEKYDAKDYKASIDYFQMYLKFKPNDLDAISNQIACYRRLNDIDNPIRLYYKLMEVNPSLKANYEKEIGKLMSYKSPEEGLKYYDSMIKVSPGTKSYLIKHSEILLKLGRRKDAIQDYIVLANIEPQNVVIKENIAVLAKLEGNLELEMVQYQDILKVQPNHMNSLFRLGCLEKEQKLFDRAMDKFTRILKIKPDYTDALIKLGSCNFEAGKRKEGCQIWLKTANDYNSSQAQELYDGFCN